MRSRVLFSSRFCTLAFVVCISHLVHGQDVVTGAATNVASNWVTLNGTANPNGSSAYVYFVYGVTSRYENKTERLGIGSGTTPVPVSINVANLPPGRTFHYKLVMNSTYGGDQAFTTLAAGSPPAWRSVQVTAQDDVARANMADGARTGAAHNDWQVYFYKGTDNNLWYVYWTGLWGVDGGDWLQTNVTSDGNVADWLAFGTSYNLLCYQGTDGKLWCVYYGGEIGQWPKVQLGEPPSGITVAGDVVIDNNWNIVYYRGSDSRVYAAQWNGSQWVHTGLGGTATVKGNLAVDASSHLIYYQGTDNQLWCEQWTGKVWQQVKLTTTANVGGSVAADHVGLLAYYRSSADNSGWTVYWNGHAWVQQQLDATAAMGSAATSFSGITPFPVSYDSLYVDSSGHCRALYWNGSKWTDVLLGDGGWGLTGGLSVNPIHQMVFARRSDGNVVLFSYH